MKRSEMSQVVLCIDDDQMILDFLETALTGYGYRVLSAFNGKEGLVKAVEQQPDLILLDIMMPDMDGWEVCQILKNNEETQKIPVIMVTARDTVYDKIKGLKKGAMGYVTKPFNVKELLEEVRICLKRAEEEE